MSDDHDHDHDHDHDDLLPAPIDTRDEAILDALHAWRHGDGDWAPSPAVDLGAFTVARQLLAADVTEGDALALISRVHQVILDAIGTPFPDAGGEVVFPIALAAGLLCASTPLERHLSALPNVGDLAEVGVRDVIARFLGVSEAGLHELGAFAEGVPGVLLRQAFEVGYPTTPAPFEADEVDRDHLREGLLLGLLTDELWWLTDDPFDAVRYAAYRRITHELAPAGLRAFPLVASLREDDQALEPIREALGGQPELQDLPSYTTLVATPGIGDDGAERVTNALEEVVWTYLTGGIGASAVRFIMDHPGEGVGHVREKSRPSASGSVL